MEMGNTDQCERTGGGEDKSIDKRTKDEIGRQNYNQQEGESYCLMRNSLSNCSDRKRKR